MVVVVDGHDNNREGGIRSIGDWVDRGGNYSWALLKVVERLKL